MKKRIYEFIRKNRLTKKIRNLANFLSSTEVRFESVPLNRHCLVLAPHQDDESIGCGGTLKLLVSSGGSFDVLFLSDGSAGVLPGGKVSTENQKSLAVVRREEAKEACKVLGASQTYFLDGVDSQFHLAKHLSEKISNLLKTKKYDLVFCPWPYESHSDHAATFRILQSALRGLKQPKLRIWLYEIWTPLIPNRIVDISSTFETKVRAINLYKSQIENTDYCEAFIGLARYRSILLRGAKYAEAFLEGDSKFILSLK